MVLSLCHSVLPKPHAATPQPLEGLFREQDTPQKAASPHAGTLQNSQNSQASQNPKDSQRQSPTESPASAECKSGDPLGDAVSQNAEKAVEGEDETPRALGSVSSLDFLKNTESPLRTPPAVHRGFREEPTQHAPLPSSRNFLCDSSNSSASAFSDEASSDDENSSGCVETPRDVCVSSGVFRGADSGSEESRPKSLLRRWLPREGISPDQEAAASRALRYTQTPSLHKEPPLRSGIAGGALQFLFLPSVAELRCFRAVLWVVCCMHASLRWACWQNSRARLRTRLLRSLALAKSRRRTVFPELPSALTPRDLGSRARVCLLKTAPFSPCCPGLRRVPRE